VECRAWAGKQAVVGLRRRDGSTQAFVVERVDEETLQALIRAHVRPGSTIYTDGHRSYLGLSDDYTHETVKHSAKEFVNGMAHTNGTESVWAVLKRGFNGVYHHWSTKHYHRYVNEFAFRLNEGNCKVNTKDRIRTLFAGMCGKRLTYAELTA